METKGPAAFKYKTDERSNATAVVAMITATFLSIIGIANFGGWFLPILLVPLLIAIYLIKEGMAKGLVIAPRYLILGDSILYYSTIAKAQLDRQRQILTLISERGKRLTIEAERFPTNARKEFKIKANRTAKFDKAVEKILARISGVAPDIIH